MQFPTVKYEFIPCPRDPGRRVEALTGLEAVFGPVTSPDVAASHAARLLTLWRRRVYDLLDNGWPTDKPAIFPDRARVILNCRPCGVASAPRSLACELIFCPACHARRARETWQTVADNLFADQVPADAVPVVGRTRTFKPRSPARARASYDVVLVERLFSVPLEAELDGEPVSGLPQFLAWRNQPKPGRGAEWHPLARGRELRRVRCAGMLEAVAPLWRKSSPDWWTVRLRQLFAVTPGAKLGLAPVDDEPLHFKRLERPARSALTRAVAWTCRYPRWLLYCPAEMLLRYVSERAGRRLTTTTGIFRGKSRPIPAEDLVPALGEVD